MRSVLTVYNLAAKRSVSTIPGPSLDTLWTRDHEQQRRMMASVARPKTAHEQGEYT
jgi:hypothetical protein